MPKMLDFIQMSLRGEIPPSPVATLIGFRLTAPRAGAMGLPPSSSK